MKLITKDLQANKEKTENQLSLERKNVDIANLGIEELIEENKTLKRNIKRTKMILDEKVLSQTAQKAKDLEKRRPSLDRRDSDSSSISNDRHSLSALGGGVQKLDIKKFDQINLNVQYMINAKNPFDCLQMILKTFKMYFKNVARCTIFLMNHALKDVCFPNKVGVFDHRRRYLKVIQLQNSFDPLVYALFADAKEYCKPCFTSMQTATKAQFEQRLIYMPITFDQQIMFAIQLESE